MGARSWYAFTIITCDIRISLWINTSSHVYWDEGINIKMVQAFGTLCPNLSIQTADLVPINAIRNRYCIGNQSPYVFMICKKWKL